MGYLALCLVVVLYLVPLVMTQGDITPYVPPGNGGQTYPYPADPYANTNTGYNTGIGGPGFKLPGLTFPKNSLTPSNPYPTNSYPKDSYPTNPYPTNQYPPKDPYPTNPYPKDPYAGRDVYPNPYPQNPYPKDPYPSSVPKNPYPTQYPKDPYQNPYPKDPYQTSYKPKNSYQDPYYGTAANAVHHKQYALDGPGQGQPCHPNYAPTCYGPRLQCVCKTCEKGGCRTYCC